MGYIRAILYIYGSYMSQLAVFLYRSNTPKKICILHYFSIYDTDRYLLLNFAGNIDKMIPYDIIKRMFHGKTTIKH